MKQISLTAFNDKQCLRIPRSTLLDGSYISTEADRGSAESVLEDFPQSEYLVHTT